MLCGTKKNLLAVGVLLCGFVVWLRVSFEISRLRPDSTGSSSHFSPLQDVTSDGQTPTVITNDSRERRENKLADINLAAPLVEPPESKPEPKHVDKVLSPERLNSSGRRKHSHHSFLMRQSTATDPLGMPSRFMVESRLVKTGAAKELGPIAPLGRYLESLQSGKNFLGRYPDVQPMPSIDPFYTTVQDKIAALEASSSNISTSAFNRITSGNEQVDDLRRRQQLFLPFDAFVSPTRRLRIISVCQDHRKYRGSKFRIEREDTQSMLPAELKPFIFAPLTDSNANMRVFQFHLLSPRYYFVVRKPTPVTERMFKRIELWWTFSRKASGGDDNGNSTAGNGTSSLLRKTGSLYTLEAGETYRILAQDIKAWVPPALDWRWKRKPFYLELMVRCVFELPESVWLSMQALNVQARFAVFAGEDIALFPLDQVVHFPHARSLLPPSTERIVNSVSDRLRTSDDGGRSKPSSSSPDGFPRNHSKSAPWSNDDLKTIVRAQGEAAKARVGAWITKKFSWNDDDDLWLRWMIDVVGVDHIVLILAARVLDIDLVANHIRDVFDVEILSRFTIMRNQAQGPNETFCYLQDLHVMDIFTRWSEDFDYALLIDTDEFLQLFESSPPYRRIDIKTFIAHVEKVMQTNVTHGFANFDRAVVTKSTPNKFVEPLAGKLLQGLLKLDGNTMDSLLRATNVSWQGLGKALFDIDRTVLPYTHYPYGYPRANWAVREAHILHIRQPFAKTNQNADATSYGLNRMLASSLFNTS